MVAVNVGGVIVCNCINFGDRIGTGDMHSVSDRLLSFICAVVRIIICCRLGAKSAAADFKFIFAKISVYEVNSSAMHSWWGCWCECRRWVRAF